MRSLTRPGTCIPFLLALAASVPVAAAASSEDLQAVQILAGAKAANARCGVLSPKESAELSQYAARAELAAASRSSASAASAAVARGRTEAAAAACTPELAADLRDTLVAARQAVEAANQSDRQPEPAEPVASPRATKGALGDYRRIVTGYYIERKCRFLSNAQARGFWRAIVKLHRAAVRSNGASAVAPVMRRAEAAAGRRPCGSSSENLVEQAYAESLSR